MQKIRTAMFGTGFMGIVHTEAIRRLGNVEVVAVSDLFPDRCAGGVDAGFKGA